MGRLAPIRGLKGERLALIRGGHKQHVAGVTEMGPDFGEFRVTVHFIRWVIPAD